MNVEIYGSNGLNEDVLFDRNKWRWITHVLGPT